MRYVAGFEPKFSVPSKIDQNLRFLAKMGPKCKKFFSGPPKGTFLRETTSFYVLIVEIDVVA